MTNNHGNIHKSMIGNLPIHKSGQNIGRLDRSSTAKMFGWSKSQISKAYNNWIQIFRIGGSDLTFEEYLNKLKAAGICPDDVGNGSTCYHLSRINDTGPYTNLTCRFLKAAENHAEQKKLIIYDCMIRKYGLEKTKEFQRKAGKLGAKKQWRK